MNRQDIVVLVVIQITPDEAVAAVAGARPALAVSPRLNGDGSTFKACPCIVKECKMWSGDAEQRALKAEF